MEYIKKEVFTDERKLDQRKQGFERMRSKKSVAKVALDEFAM